ncbi:MAG: hypothetical protein M0R66_03975, partial [Candidatus Omnitrophica bacterium]|nr:hypothetical protein [Candidatus Omnitrophota bacterium]
GKLPTLDAGIFHVDVPDARFVVKKDDFVVDVDVMSAVPMAVDGITALLFRGTKRNAEGAYEPAFVCVAGDVVVMATEREVLEKYDAVDPVDPKSLKSSYDLSKFANERTSLAIFAFVQAVVAGSAFEPEASV